MKQQIVRCLETVKQHYLYQILRLIIWFPIVMLYPRNKKKILFGAWNGEQYSDNPKYFLKYLQSLNKGFDCVWIGNESVRSKVEADGVKFALRGSREAQHHLLTAKWLVSNLGAECDVTCLFPTYGRIKQLTFWHGAAYKGTCGTNKIESLSKNPFKRFKQYFLSKQFSIATPLWSWASFSFEEMRSIMPKDCPWQFKKEMSIDAGTARVDYLINNANNDEEISRVKKSIGALLGLPVEKRWYLYMPTWRKSFGINFSFNSTKQIEKLSEILEKQNAILIEKQHPHVLLEHNVKGGWNGNVYTISSENATLDIDTQELLLASDRLITDYSSCFCDFAPMKRPVIHFVYDYDEYVKGERNEAHDIREYAVGPVAYNENEFMKMLGLSDEEMFAMKGPKANDLIEGETGHACETFAKWVGLI